MNDILDTVRLIGGMDAIRAALRRLQQDVRAYVAGECIRDVYRYVRPEGLSSKSPTLSCRWVREESSRGGSWAIANHLREFCPVTQSMSGVVHSKIRYISETTGQRLFEVCDIREERSIAIDATGSSNLLIVADFGHGLFDKTELPRPLSRGGPVYQAMNVQTNSSNFGFNPFHKRRCDYLVIDKRELQLGFNDRDTNPISLGARLHEEWRIPLAVTLGPAGSVMFFRGEVHACQAFTPRGVIDATGAGDAYFALTSALVRISANPALTVFLGNVFAGLKTQIVGNSRPVGREALLSTCSEILDGVRAPTYIPEEQHESRRSTKSQGEDLPRPDRSEGDNPTRTSPERVRGSRKPAAR